MSISDNTLIPIIFEEHMWVLTGENPLDKVSKVQIENNKDSDDQVQVSHGTILD